MIYAGNREVKEIWAGGRPAAQAWCGGLLAWPGRPPAEERWELCFTAEQANSTVGMAKVGRAPGVSLEYSTDGLSWTRFYVGQTTVQLANAGDKMWLRAPDGSPNQKMSSSSSACNKFAITGLVAASGSVMSLLDGTGPTATLSQQYALAYIFQNCTALTEPPELPATTLTNYCYNSMFGGCTSLRRAPELPATTLGVYCYSDMFLNCTSLTAAPASLSATTLASSCCWYMFYNCSSLTAAPALPATTLASDCYHAMFRSCASLTAAPALPATTLASNCYTEMFIDSGVSAISASFVDWSDGTSNWLENVAAEGTFYCPAALGTDSTIQRGSSYCPDGWNVVNTDDL